MKAKFKKGQIVFYVKNTDNYVEICQMIIKDIVIEKRVVYYIAAHYGEYHYNQNILYTKEDAKRKAIELIKNL